MLLVPQSAAATCLWRVLCASVYLLCSSVYLCYFPWFSSSYTAVFICSGWCCFLSSLFSSVCHIFWGEARQKFILFFIFLFRLLLFVVLFSVFRLFVCLFACLFCHLLLYYLPGIISLSYNVCAVCLSYRAWWHITLHYLLCLLDNMVVLLWRSFVTTLC